MRGFNWLQSRAPFSVIASVRGFLGVAAINELLWRGLSAIDATTGRRLARLLGEQDIAPALLSVVSIYVTEIQLIATISEWLFIAALFYVYTPKVFRARATEFTERESFRVITTLATCGFALVFASLVLGSPVDISRPSESAGGFLVACAAAITGYGLFFRYEANWPDQSLDERIAVLAAFIPVPDAERTAIREGITAAGHWATLRAYTLFLSVVFTCVIHVFFFSTLSVIVFGLFPLVEILILLSVGLGWLRRRYPNTFDWADSISDVLDIETRLYDVVSTAGRGIKGWVGLVLCIVFGLFGQAVILGFALPVVLQDVRLFLHTASSIGITTPFVAVRTWNVLGVGLSFLTASAFGVWFWLRMLERLPAFLEDWERAVGLRAASEREPATTRPLGVMMPPSLALFAATLWLIHVSRTTGRLVVTPQDVAYALIWPAILCILLASVWLTLHREPQDAASDNRALPAALLVQIGIGFVFLWLEFPAETGGQAVSVGFSPLAVMMLVAIPFFFYLQDVYLWGERRDGIGMYAFPAALGSFGGFVIVLGTIPTTERQFLFLVLGITTLLGASVLAVDQFLSTDR